MRLTSSHHVHILAMLESFVCKGHRETIANDENDSTLGSREHVVEDEARVCVSPVGTFHLSVDIHQSPE